MKLGRMLVLNMAEENGRRSKWPQIVRRDQQKERKKLERIIHRRRLWKNKGGVMCETNNQTKMRKRIDRVFKYLQIQMRSS